MKNLLVYRKDTKHNRAKCHLILSYFNTMKFKYFIVLYYFLNKNLIRQYFIKSS